MFKRGEVSHGISEKPRQYPDEEKIQLIVEYKKEGLKEKWQEEGQKLTNNPLVAKFCKENPQGLEKMSLKNFLSGNNPEKIQRELQATRAPKKEE